VTRVSGNRRARTYQEKSPSYGGPDFPGVRGRLSRGEGFGGLRPNLPSGVWERKGGRKRSTKLGPRKGTPFRGVVRVGTYGEGGVQEKGSLHNEQKVRQRERVSMAPTVRTKGGGHKPTTGPTPSRAEEQRLKDRLPPQKTTSPKIKRIQHTVCNLTSNA